MELYYQILVALLRNDLFDKYRGAVQVAFLRENAPDLLRLFLVLDELHKSYRVEGRDAFDASDLEAGCEILYPNSSNQLTKLVDNVRGREPVDRPVLEEYLRVLKLRADASAIAYVALDVAEGRKKPDELHNLVDKLEAEVVIHDPESDFVDDSLDSILTAVTEGGLHWRLRSLNASIGPLRKGSFGFFFARPEMGKTTFWASEGTFMAEQADGDVLWFNNEQAHEVVVARLYEAALGAPLDKIMRHQKAAETKYKQLLRDRLKVVKDPKPDRSLVERLCKIYQPKLIIFDQLDKIGGFEGDRNDLLLGEIYQWARDLAKEYGPTVGISQADGTAEGIKYLNMGHVANAKTAKQAEADWILGMGRSLKEHDMIRGMAISKNKHPHSEGMDVHMRHGRWEIMIQPEIARFIDV